MTVINDPASFISMQIKKGTRITVTNGEELHEGQFHSVMQHPSDPDFWVIMLGTDESFGGVPLVFGETDVEVAE